MSKIKTIEMKCPHCGSVEKIQIWETVNVTLDSSFKTKILNGDLFKYVEKFATQIDKEIQSNEVVGLLTL